MLHKDNNIIYVSEKNTKDNIENNNEDSVSVNDNLDKVDSDEVENNGKEYDNDDDDNDYDEDYDDSFDHREGECFCCGRSVMAGTHCDDCEDQVFFSFTR